jgi:uncharacterized membrane protein YkvA (DUF1232 family)
MDWGPAFGVVAGLLAAWILFVGVLWVIRPRGVSLGELARVVPDIVRLVRALLVDRSVPWPVRAATAGLLVWLLNPIDLIPEFIPLLGPIDDVVVAVLVLRYVWRRLGAAEFSRRWPGTRRGLTLLRGVMGSSP